MIPTKNGWFHTKHDHIGYFYHWNQSPVTEQLGHWGMVPSCGMVNLHVQSCIHIGYGHRSHTLNPNIVDIMVMTVIPSGFPLNDHSLHQWHNSISFPWHSWTVHGVRKNLTITTMIPEARSCWFPLNGRRWTRFTRYPGPFFMGSLANFSPFST